jgi:hypothetical protein
MERGAIHPNRSIADIYVTRLKSAFVFVIVEAACSYPAILFKTPKMPDEGFGPSGMTPGASPRGISRLRGHF